tara:strand:- start:244 stop:1446 length:1203 start_codon:yes stop_codon:yes gene_type:complete
MTPEGKNMTKALIVEAAPTLGGSLTSIELVIRHGKSMKLEFGLMSLFDPQPYLDIPLRSYMMSDTTHVHHQIEQFFYVLDTLIGESYDALILNNIVDANFPALIAGIMARKPILQFVRAFERKSKLWSALSPFVDTFVAVSEAIKEHLLSMNVPHEKILLAPEGIAYKARKSEWDAQQLKQSLSLPQEAKTISFLGRIVPWKGTELFVQTALQSIEQTPQLHALIIGEAPPEQMDYMRSLQALVAQRGMQERIHFLGAVPPEEVYPLLRGTDLMLHTSIEPEPFGRVILESMSVGTPVLSSSYGGPEEIITHREDGLLCPGADAQTLAAQVNWFFATPERREQMGTKSRETAQTKFSEASCASPVLEWLTDVAPTLDKHFKTQRLIKMLPLKRFLPNPRL